MLFSTDTHPPKTKNSCVFFIQPLPSSIIFQSPNGRTGWIIICFSAIWTSPVSLKPMSVYMINDENGEEDNDHDMIMIGNENYHKLWGTKLEPKCPMD